MPTWLTKVALDTALAFGMSALFWLTVAGVIFRVLQINFQEVEAWLKQFYASADKTTFNARQIALRFCEDALTALYSGPQLVLSIALPCLLLLSLIVVRLAADWHSEHAAVEARISAVVARVDPEYWPLKHTARGRAEIDFAEEEIPRANGSTFLAHIDSRSTHVRDVVYGFEGKYLDQIRAGRLEYYDLLDRMFGDARSSYQAADLRARLVLLIIFGTLLPALVLDSIGALCALQIVKDARGGTYRLTPLYLGVIAACVVLQIVNYNAFLFGTVGILGWLALLLAGGLAIGALVVGAISGGFDAGSASNSGPGRLGSSLVGVVFVALFLLPFTTAAPRLWHWLGRMAASLSDALTLHATITTVGFSAVPAFQLVFVLSVLVTAMLAKVVFAVVKHAALGNIYGATVLSGGTFFCGFLSLVVTTTSLIWGLFEALNHH